MKAEIITIGDELLIGQVIDSNSAFMAKELNKIGIKVHRITSISDNRSTILTTLDASTEESDVIICTGGLGPTKDDITKDTIASFFSDTLEFNADIFSHIKNYLESRGVEVKERNRQQACVPLKATCLHNPYGTASGLYFFDNNTRYFFLPGVPYEMKHLMVNEIIPILKQISNQPAIYHRTILTSGVPESEMAEKIKHFETRLPSNLSLAYLPSPGILRLRLTAYQQANAEKLVEKHLEHLKSIVSDYIFGYDETTLEEVVSEWLKRHKKTLCIAESCSGGNISASLVALPGASDFFKGSVVAYNNQIKEEILNIPRHILKEHGAVSQEVVEKMAVNVRQLFAADYSIATSGIAGPDGGSDDKPVGTTWIAVASNHEIISKNYTFGNLREINIRKTTVAGLFMLYKVIQE